MTIAKYGLTLFIGAVTGVLAFIVQKTVKSGTETKLQYTEMMLNNFGLALGFATHTSISVSLVLIASCLVRRARHTHTLPRTAAVDLLYSPSCQPQESGLEASTLCVVRMRRHSTWACGLSRSVNDATRDRRFNSGRRRRRAAA
jgi:hypothetical protein